MRYISLMIEINSIKYFLEKNLKIIDKELSYLIKRKEDGEDCHYMEEFQNKSYVVLECEQIATRAVFSEVNALIEWMLYCFASLLTEKYSKDKKYKFVFNMPISCVVSSIEKQYRIELNDLPGYKELKDMREKINAFKHQKGFKDFRKNKNLEIDGIQKRYEIDREDAYGAIKNAEIFIKAFWDKLYLWPDLERIRRQEENGYIEWQE